MRERQNEETSLVENSVDHQEYHSSRDAIPLPDKSPQLYVPRCGLILYVMTFCGIWCTYSQRASISQAIVAAVNTSAVAEDVLTTNASADDQCPRDPELQLLNGELDWSRSQQGTVLAAFHFGYEFTQVCSVILKSVSFRLLLSSPLFAFVDDTLPTFQ